MFEFTIGLADQIIQVNSMYKGILNYCKDFLCQGEPDFSVTTAPEDIVFEREKSAREDALEGIPVREFSKPYLEKLAVYRKIADQMLKVDTMLFHGSAIAVDGAAYLFTAKSGTGKSTHTALWREKFGDRAVMINDDKPLLRMTEDGVWVYGTPWNGKHRLGINGRAPLRAICILERGLENHIERIEPVEALAMLLQQSYRPADPVGMGLLLGLLDRLTRDVRLYRLSCNMDPEAAVVAYEAMSRQ